MDKIVITKTLYNNCQYDVIVCGGGPAGCSAAIAAARLGARTLLVESSGALGGMATGGLVTSFAPFSDGEKIIYRGIAQEVLEKVKSSVNHTSEEKVDWVEIDPEKLKIIYDDMLIESGAEVLFFTTVYDVITNNSGTVQTIIAGNKSGLCAYSAKCFVDCTGDADICVKAGAQYHIGDVDGTLQYATLCFMMSNVNDSNFLKNTYIDGEERLAGVIRRDEEFPLINDSHLCNDHIAPGLAGFNAMHICADATNPKSVTDGMMIGRKMAYQMRDALRKHWPEAFSESEITSTAPLLGIRESRIIVGEYTLTLDDYLTKRSFDDEICRNSYFIDFHSTSSEIENEKWTPYGKGDSHGIPYRCLVPKGLNNVITAGRSISCGRAVSASTRVMPVCLATGQAAGTAAYLATTQNKSFNDIDTNLLRSILRENGAYFNDGNK